MPRRPPGPEPELGGGPPPSDGPGPIGHTAWWSRAHESIVLVWLRLTHRIQAGQMAIYVGVGSLIGADALALVVSSAAIWPVGIPFLILGLGLIYLVRRRVPNRRRQPPRPDASLR